MFRLIPFIIGLLSFRLCDTYQTQSTFESLLFNKTYHVGPTNLNLYKAEEFCDHQQAQIWEPSSQDEQDFIVSKIEQLEPSPKAWKHIWLGIPESFNSYSHFFSGKPIEWSNWFSSQPDGSIGGVVVAHSRALIISV